MRSLVLVCCVSVAYADPAMAPPVKEKPPEISPLKSVPEASLSPLHFLPSDLDRIEHKARVRRAIGIGLVVPGVVLMVAGAVLIGVGAHDTQIAQAGLLIDPGIIGVAAGVVFTAPGAYLWIDGQDSLDTAAWRRQRAAP